MVHQRWAGDPILHNSALSSGSQVALSMMVRKPSCTCFSSESMELSKCGEIKTQTNLDGLDLKTTGQPAALWAGRTPHTHATSDPHSTMKGLDIVLS